MMWSNFLFILKLFPKRNMKAVIFKEQKRGCAVMKRLFDHKHFLGYVAVAMACVMLLSGLTLTMGSSFAQAESAQLATKLEGVVTSPFTAAVQAVRDSVVGVNNYRTYTNYNYGYGYYGRDRNQEAETREVKQSSGSGVVISAEGHVLTNYHVVEGASTLKVSVGDNEYETTLIAYDADLDIAIVKAPDLNLNPVSLGNSDTLQIGEWAICIGNPLSDTFTGTTTVGIISGLNRQISTGSTIDNYGRRAEVINAMIQTDAAINSGNSGGGMFNVLGELVGIPTIKYSGSSSFFSSGASIEGIGMCIPINSAKPLIESVLSGEIKEPATEVEAEDSDEETISGNYGKPRMGVTISTVTGSSFNNLLPSGAYISAVEEGSPAEVGGLIPGDIIVEKDGVIITSNQQIIDLVGEMKVGDTMKLTVYRAEGLYEVMERYMNGERLSISEIPTDGEYVEVTVGLAMLDEATEEKVEQ